MAAPRKQTKASPGKKAAKPTGRPSSYTQDLAERVCALIAQGDSVATIGAMDGLPDARTIFRWLASNAGGTEDDPASFRQQYMRARASRADARFERLDEIMEEVRTGKLDPSAARVMMDAIKWQSGKENAKRYGEKLQLADADGDKLPPPPPFYIMPVAPPARDE
ncbi:hypothetical protein [Stenotrophomonas sp. 278]|uniref:terminase small subunit-like protein n=1 Tax=Stenotrophomonas sp. 278 TaxID=2479851 RepID=UPI000F6883D9|nr:hypothetical protein [Stenotrophomonas sp. 278]